MLILPRKMENWRLQIESKFIDKSAGVVSESMYVCVYQRYIIKSEASFVTYLAFVSYSTHPYRSATHSLKGFTILKHHNHNQQCTLIHSYTE